jgi:type IV pilus assembly protein PilE
MKPTNHEYGFTLIELLIVIVVIGILAVISVSLYKSFILKSRRSDGINAILTLQLAEERYRSNNAQYGSIAQIGGSSTSPQGYYSLAISNVGASSYSITASAQGNQANDSEGSTSCASLTLTVSNGTATQTPPACWPS